MINPIMTGFAIASMTFGACAVKVMRIFTESKVTQVAFDVFCSIGIVYVSALHFHTAVISNVLILSMVSLSMLILMQAVDIFVGMYIFDN